MKPHLLHPVAVHFPIAMLVFGFAAALAGRWSERWARQADAVSWILWLGTAAAWVAVGLGLLAEETAPHVPSAWQAIALHRTLAFSTSSVFAVLSLWRWRRPQARPRLFMLAWAAGAALILWTGLEGGELVFEHNMGTAATAEP